METGPMSSEITCGTCHHELGLEKGKERQRKGTGAVSKCLAPPVAKSCYRRGNFLRRTCEFLVSAAKRQAFLC